MLFALGGLAIAGPGQSVLPDATRRAAVDSVNRPLAERIDRISATMLDHPYLADPLGEGAGDDPDPLVRYDTYDCLTFVEEVVALALAPEPVAAGPIRTSLRYGGPTAYSARHHFMELQWVPSALEQGWLRDTTAAYGPTQTMEKAVGPEIWKTWAGRAAFAMTDEQLPTGAMRLEVLDLDAAIAAAERIRPGTIVLTVRADRSWKPIWTSHVGIVVPGDRPTVRHATKLGKGSTRDHGLVWYLEHLKTYTNWPAVGVSLLEPIPYGPRLARLPDGAVPQATPEQKRDPDL